MAQTWGDIIGRNYGTGRAIGDDFATTRFSRNAQKLKQQYSERAAAEGKTLEDYLPDLERDLEQLAVKVGATRRNVTGRSGKALDREYAGSLYEDVGRASERRAGTAALAGDQAGARDTRARTQYAIGDFDAGQGQQIAGDTIRATSSAMSPDGQYNMAQGAQNLAGVGARYGNAEQANAQQQGATTFRLQAARAKADSLFNMAQNPEAFSPDQFAGAWEGFKENVPELDKMDLRKGPDNVLYLYTNGSPTGSFDPKNQTDVQELASLMGQFTKDPGTALQGFMQSRLKSIEESKARDTKIGDDYRAARIDVIKGLTAKGLPPELANKVVDAQQKVQGGGGGWQLQDIGAEPGTFLMQKNGKVYTIKTNVSADPAKGEAGGTLQVFDGEGNPVAASVLNKDDETTLRSTLVDLASSVAASNYRLQTGVLRDQLQILNELESQERGFKSSGGGGGNSGGNSRAERNNNPGNIEDGPFAKGLPGYAGSDGRFAKFDTPEAGQQAQGKLLQSYGRRGYNTVEKIVGRWSPEADPTNQAGSTRNYMNYVAKRLGVSPGDQLDLNNPQVATELAMAMAEFESGNTSGKSRSPVQRQTAATASAPAKAQPATARSAPAAQTPLPRRAEITPDYVRGAAKDLDALRSKFQNAKVALERFNEDFPSEAQPRMSSMQAGALPSVGRGYATPEQQRVGDRLAREVAAAEQELREATGELRANTGALKRQTAGKRQTDREEALYSQYGGAADFFRAAK